MKPTKQSEATNYIERLLIERGFNIPSRKLLDQWVIFEHEGKQIGVDSSSGVWVRELKGEWKCLAKPCNVSGAIQAVEFLTTGL